MLRIPESQQDAATALSGSGPAYVYFLVEAMVDAGILLGMPRGTALEMVNQAVYGAATMLRDTGEHPVHPARGGDLARRDHDRGHPGAGAARGPGRVPGRDRGGPGPGAGSSGQARTDQEGQ